MSYVKSQSEWVHTLVDSMDENSLKYFGASRPASQNF